MFWGSRILAVVISFCPALANAVVCDNVTIKQVVNGNVVLAEGAIGNSPVLVPVRLLYIQAPETGTSASAEEISAAKKTLERWAVPLLRYVLWAPGEDWSYDEHGRLLAVVWEYFAYHDNAGLPVPIQINVVAAGHAKRYAGHGEVSNFKEVKASLDLVEEVARKAKSGFWGLESSWLKKEPGK